MPDIDECSEKSGSLPLLSESTGIVNLFRTFEEAGDKIEHDALEMCSPANELQNRRLVSVLIIDRDARIPCYFPKMTVYIFKIT